MIKGIREWYWSVTKCFNWVLQGVLEGYRMNRIQPVGADGKNVGCVDGSVVGGLTGCVVGCCEGCVVGSSVGWVVGWSEGSMDG